MRKYIVSVRWVDEPSDMDVCCRSYHEEIVEVIAHTQSEAVEKAKNLWEGFWEFADVVGEESASIIEC